MYHIPVNAVGGLLGFVPPPPELELVFVHDTVCWNCMLVEDGLYTTYDTLPDLQRNGFADAGVAALMLLPTQCVAMGGGTIKLPPGLPSDAIDEYIRNYKALFGEDDVDPRDEAGTPPHRACHVDGHVWVDTGLLRSWCKYCSEDAEWSREHGKYMPRHRVARRYDA
jgi:hypothetical protein